MQHVSVLLEESIIGLDIHPKDIVVDGTFGGGGHSAMIAERVPSVTLICVDLDEAAQERFDARFGNVEQRIFVHANFQDVSRILGAAGVSSVNRVLLDLGTSSFQLGADTRGFSFMSDAPLSMAFSSKGSHTNISAWDIVNLWEEESIADVIYAYGEERKSRRIAKAIIEARAKGPINTSRALAAIIEAVVPRSGKIHPATKTFQAFRITVNDELQVIENALDRWWQVLAPGGRIAVISFHSLEDRVVKQWMKKQTNERVITKKPIVPTREELQANPKSRSAKLRIIEKEYIS